MTTISHELTRVSKSPIGKFLLGFFLIPLVFIAFVTIIIGAALPLVVGFCMYGDNAGPWWLFANLIWIMFFLGISNCGDKTTSKDNDADQAIAGSPMNPTVPAAPSLEEIAAEAFVDREWSRFNGRKEDVREAVRYSFLAGYASASAKQEERERGLIAALEGVIAVADRKTKEFDAARAALAEAKLGKGGVDG